MVRDPRAQLAVLRQRNMARIDNLPNHCQRRVQQATSKSVNAILASFNVDAGDEREWSLILNVGMRVLAILVAAEPDEKWGIDAVCQGLQEHYSFFHSKTQAEPLATSE